MPNDRSDAALRERLGIASIMTRIWAIFMLCMRQC